MAFLFGHYNFIYQKGPFRGQCGQDPSSIGRVRSALCGQNPSLIGKGRFAPCGQTITETAILFLVIVFAFVAMQVYLKRAMQGRLRGNIDQIGEQYDPQKTTSEYNMTHVSNTVTTTETQEGVALNPFGLPSQNRLVTTVVSNTIYDNTVRTGYEDVGNY